MPIATVPMMNLSLDLMYGASKGAIAPAELEVALFMGDPTVIDPDTGLPVGTEVTATSDTDSGVVANGYARVTVANDGGTWLAADEGMKSTAAPIAFPAALAEYPGSVTHVGLYNKATGDLGDVTPLVEPLDVTAAGDGPLVVVTVFYDDAVQAA